jgi:hypothetical protein
MAILKLPLIYFVKKDKKYLPAVPAVMPLKAL